MSPHQQAREVAKRLVRSFFKNDEGNPFEMTDSQADIFLVIYTRSHPRNQVIASTQFGKSEIVAMALILRSITFSERWAIVSGSADKAGIIMGKVIQHIFDHDHFYKKLELDPNMPLDKLKRQRSKENITWMGGGGIKIFTANTSNRQKVKESLTGFGAQNIVEDEASLIPDDIQAMILRMLGGYADNFLLKIGNPFYRNHFHKTWNSSRYNKVFIDYKIALAEGRYTQDFIEEMRNEPFFDVLYECKFPESDQIYPGGYRSLFPDTLIQSAFITEEEAKKLGLMDGDPERLGSDIGGGGDRSTHVLRWAKVMKLVDANRLPDTMQQVPIIEGLIDMYNIEPGNAALDYGGLGQGVGDRLHERNVEVNKVMFGSSAPGGESKKYLNMRSYMYYKLFTWLKEGGRIIEDDSFMELTVINYKENSEKRLQIQPKEELKKLLKTLGMAATSPDVADGAALTFADNSVLMTEDDFDIV